jgi:SNF2 family DNA or RNA helicase
MNIYLVDGSKIYAKAANQKHELNFSEIVRDFTKIQAENVNLELCRAMNEVSLSFKSDGGSSSRLGIEIFLKHRKNVYPVTVDGSKFNDYVVSGNFVVPIGIQGSDILNAISEYESRNIHFRNNLQIRDLVFIENLASTYGICLGASELRDNWMRSRLKIPSESDFGLAKKPYAYQAVGIEWLRSQQEFGRSGVILADVMGLGKTLQGIGLITLNALSGLQNNLVVCPNSLVENWRREIRKFSPDLSLLVHVGPMRTGSAKNLREYDLVVTSYDAAVADYEILKLVSWNVIILDEAQYIKNPEAKRTKIVKRLSRKFSVAISGTPIENHLLDLWSIADFVDSSILGSRSEFENNYEDSSAPSLLVNSQIRPFILRRNLKDVDSQLPEKVVSDVPLRWPIELNDIYENVRLEAIKEFASAGGLVATGRLRKLTTHPLLMEIGPRDLCKLSPKFEMTVELLRKISTSGEKALIFSSYLKMTDLLVEFLRDEFDNAFVHSIDGRTSTSDRQPLIDQFNEYEGFGVLVCNPIVAGVGLNITGANHVIHYNLEWNPAKEDQATFRIYRPGQTRISFIYRLFYLDTIDEIIDQRIQLKRELADLTIDPERVENDYEEALKVSPVRALHA